MLTIEDDIVEALRDLRQCRADHEHSPNAETTRCVQYAELRLNKLLDRLHVANTYPGGVLLPTLLKGDTR